MMETLKLNKEFRRAYGRGKTVSAPALVVYAIKNRAGVCRYGITTSKKVGNAVERSRCRRIIREALRTLDEPFRGNWDLVFVARGKTKYLKSTQVQQTMRAQLRKLGVLSAETGTQTK
ncbi:MAG: ribonuclease P protein component [Oscillospiraceae bacterium]|jgi:ribonuclease P protein component|nr:ribonuclease P protein component [Oscillospiraceae bacterium]